jgi:hypothetical protein
MTFSAWIYPFLVGPPAPGPRTILSRGDGGGGGSEYIFQIGNSAPGDLALFVNGWYKTQGGVVPDSQWSHVAATFDGLQNRFYVNGNLIATIPHQGSALTQSGTPLYIGRQGSTCNCNLMSGTIDEIQIWDRVLTQSEIQAGMFARFTRPEPGLVAYFGFNDFVSATTATTVGVGSKAGTATLRGIETGYLRWTTLGAPQPAQVDVGAPLAPPSGALNSSSLVYYPPTVTSLQGPGSTFWSSKEQRLYLLQPGAVQISWYTSANLTDTIQEAFQGQWPANPQIAVANTPVDLENPISGYHLQGVKYSEPNNIPDDYEYDPLTKRLLIKEPGYATLQYTIGGSTPLNYTNYVQVVRAVAWDHPDFLQSGVQATVGTKVTDPRGFTTPKSGFVVFTNTPIDSIGSDAAYLRTNQTGPIIPVNVPLAGVESNLVVAFYAQHPKTGVLWPDKPVRFNIAWPSTSDSIVIANTNGVPVASVDFPDKLIYSQPNPKLPGYNPNEEHALLTGSRLFALRNDLNRLDTSQPYVLLKYREGGEWKMKTYAVVLSSGSFSFRYSGEVGKELNVPFPMTLVERSGCATIPSGPVFGNWNGVLYGARGPIPEDPGAEAVLQLQYQAQQLDFFFPKTDGSREHDPSVTCTTWSGLVAGASQPINVTYRIHWPVNNEVPVLQVGETLIKTKHLLPAISDWAKAEVVFDSLNPNNDRPLSSVARLYDPLSERRLALTKVISQGNPVPANYAFPGIKLEGVGTEKIFSDLPYYLRQRLSLDTQAHELTFKSVFDGSVSPEPFLLNNVLTPRERDRILQLSTDQTFQDIITALYNLTRNPAGADVNGDGQPDAALLTGFKTEYVYTNSATHVLSNSPVRLVPVPASFVPFSTNVLRDPPPPGSRALTAGQSLPSTSLFGKAVKFSGANFVEVTNASGLPGNAFTLEAWVRPDAAKCNTILSRGIGFQSADLILNVGFDGANCGSSKVGFYSGRNWDASSSTVPLNVWTHVAVTFDGNEKRFYINGVLDRTAPRAGGVEPLSDSEHLYLGRQGSVCNCNFFEGVMDEIRIWRKVRTAQEIATFMATPLSGLEEDLAGYWRFDDSGFQDSSAYFRDGVDSVGGLSTEASAAGLEPVPAGRGAEFPGGNGYVALPDNLFPYPASGTGNDPFTFEVWFQTSSPGAILGQQAGLPYQGTAGYIPALYVGLDGRLRAKFFYGLPSLASPAPVNDGQPHHAAATYDGVTFTLFLDGQPVASGQGTQLAYSAIYQYQLGTAFGTDYPAAPSGWFDFQGVLDEVRVWTAARSSAEIQTSMHQPLSGNEPNLVGYWRFEETDGLTAIDQSPLHRDARLELNVQRGVSPVQLLRPLSGAEARYLVLAENNAPGLGLPFALHIIQVGGGPFKGDLKVLPPDNPFDERLSIRHSSDFGGDPTGLEFQWYYHPDTGPGVRTTLPVVNPSTGAITDLKGWEPYPVSPADGATTITLGEGTALRNILLSDNWIICRYRGYAIGGRTDWSPWVGSPGAGGEAQLAPGWVKRVTEKINPFEQRFANFHRAATDTYASMLTQAGKRYEGDIALNPNTLTNVGLIETYTTVLNRARDLTIDGVPSVEDLAANNAMLLAASRIADLYILLGNEAFADAADPTIGFDVSGTYGSAAPSIFAFQNQLPSLLEEELALLRGRDAANASVTAPPYNHLLWNFTHDRGEVAYAHVYNVSDVNLDGVINESDASIMYPQGHGDAWGHYLTALTTYYDLLRHPHYTWIPRSEATDVTGVPVEVDYLDERKFAKAAAARARAGAQVVDLTYRLNYVEDPAGQFQGYKDSDSDRAWGVSQWARRAAQGAFFDWVTANAILPASDTLHTGIQKVDRTTVPELEEIAAQHEEVQAQIDKADHGLNPLGLAAGSVPFDIDPASVAQGKTHYEQISARALTAVNNALALFNYANQFSQSLRRNQDTQQQLANNTNDKERDYKNRLIEIFGYPYTGDVGGSGTYPSGYSGPDLYHFQYVNASDLTDEPGVPQTSITAYYQGITLNNATTPAGSVSSFPTDVPDASVVAIPPGSTFQVTYPFSTGDYGLVAPASWGNRSAPGKLQGNLSDLLRAEAKLKQALVKYDLLLQQIRDATDILDAQYFLNAEKIGIRSAEFSSLTSMTAFQLAAKAAGLNAKRVASAIKESGTVWIESLPKSVGTSSDVFAPLRGLIYGTSTAVKQTLEIAGDNLDFTEYAIDKNKDTVKNAASLTLEVESQKYDVLQKVKALQQLVRSEVQSRFELYDLKEAATQAAANYRTTLAQGLRLLEERAAYRRAIASTTQQARYNDMTFRIFQNDALQKYRAQVDLAARYVYLAAKAYDFETCLLGSETDAGQRFLTDIIRARSLGQIVGGVPVASSGGLTAPLAAMDQNFMVEKGKLGFLTPETETGRFSLRTELLRVKSGTNAAAVANWRQELAARRVDNLWDLPEFRKFCQPFAKESDGPQPALVIEFATTVTSGLNYFGRQLGGGDSFYDSSRFATKIRTAGVWFTGYDTNVFTATPRVYLIPAGADIMRTPRLTRDIRVFNVVDQQLPTPYAIGNAGSLDAAWIPANDMAGGEDLGGIRQFSQFRAYHDSGEFKPDQATVETRLIGRSVWNTRWMLIIPGVTFGADKAQLERFINAVTDIKIFFQTYAYSG